MFAATRVAARTTAQCASRQSQKRTMAGGAKPEWTGIDKTVRDVFPEDWQLAAAIMSGYGSLVVLAKIRGAMKGSPPPAPEPVKVAAATPAAASGTVPSVESEEFAAFCETDAFDKLLDSDEQLGAALAD